MASQTAASTTASLRFAPKRFLQRKSAAFLPALTSGFLLLSESRASLSNSSGSINKRLWNNSNSKTANSSLDSEGGKSPWRWRFCWRPSHVARAETSQPRRHKEERFQVIFFFFFLFVLVFFGSWIDVVLFGRSGDAGDSLYVVGQEGSKLLLAWDEVVQEREGPKVATVIYSYDMAVDKLTQVYTHGSACKCVGASLDGSDAILAITTEETREKDGVVQRYFKVSNWSMFVFLLFSKFLFFSFVFVVVFFGRGVACGGGIQVECEVASGAASAVCGLLRCLRRCFRCFFRFFFHGRRLPRHSVSLYD